MKGSRVVWIERRGLTFSQWIAKSLLGTRNFDGLKSFGWEEPPNTDYRDFVAKGIIQRPQSPEKEEKTVFIWQ